MARATLCCALLLTAIATSAEALRGLQAPESKLIYYHGKWGRPLERDGPLPNCASSCSITSDAEQLQRADAAIWNSCQVLWQAEPPAEKRPGQRWLFSYFLEAPHYSWAMEHAARERVAVLDRSQHVDWTMTYNSHSDFFWPFAKLVRKSDPAAAEFRRASGREREDQQAQALVAKWRKRPRIMAALVSNCVPRRLRMLLQLQQLLPEGALVVYGHCGKPFPCPKGDEACEKRVLRKYQFYAAFENHRVRGYISEKFFRALDAGVVPLALGGLGRPDYERLGVPRSAMVHVDDFGSLGELATFLQEAKSSPKLDGIFDWRREMRVAGYEETREQVFCELCRELHKPAAQQRPARTFGDQGLVSWWWNQPEGGYLPWDNSTGAGEE